MDEKVLLIREKIQEKLNQMNKKTWHKVFERNAEKEALLTIADVVDKVDHNYQVVTKITQKKTRKLLFVVNPSGPTNFDSSRLRETYGKLVLNGTAKSLRVPLFAHQDTLFDNKYNFRLIINREEEKIYIRITGKRGKLYEEKVYWTFDSLKKMIEKKIKKIALIEYEHTFHGLDEYFKLNDVILYEKVNFNKFIDALEYGYIRVYLKVAVYTSGIYIGKTHDHGATFQIIDKNLIDIFDKQVIKASK